MAHNFQPTTHEGFSADWTIYYCQHCGKQSFGRTRDLPSQIRALRKAQGLTQQDLAERMCITQESIARWESWQYDNYSLRSLRAIAHALGARLIVALVPREN